MDFAIDQNPPPSPQDPRSRGFRTRRSVAELQSLIDARVSALPSECVSIGEAARRVLAHRVGSDRAVPAFDRAAMDGFALHGEETFGATAFTPARFTIVGRSRPGDAMSIALGRGQAIAIATGAPMPSGADAVVPVEIARCEAAALEVLEPVPPRRHVSHAGEDILPGTVVLPANRFLRPQDLGVLSAIGRGEVGVVRRPRVTIIVTGDELLAAGSAPFDHRIPDANSPMLAALVAIDGGQANVIGPVRDDRSQLASRIAEACDQSDAVFVTGGSSTGPEDHAPSIVAERGELAVHGVALRPASPTGLGFVGNVPVLLIPGNPVSCLCAYDFFGGRLVRRLGGRATQWGYRSTVLPLARKLVSILGRVDYVRVCLVDNRVEPLATGGASILSSTTRADGFVVVPENLEGYATTSEVTVWLYDG